MNQFGRNILLVVIGAAGSYYIRDYFAGGVCKSSARLDKKTVIITGCNSGIGKETAKDLSKRGAKIIMACRNIEEADNVAAEIRKSNAENAQNSGELVVVKLDLSRLESIRSFANHIIQNEERLDILINNAGIVSGSMGNKTEDGFEETIGVNHLGPFLLTNLLINKLASAPELPSRIVNVASNAHRRGKINLEDLNGDIESNPMVAYGQSKLANILFTNELAKRLKENGQEISVYSLHPGVIHTNLFRQFDRTYRVLMICAWGILWPFLKSCKEGAQTTIYCSVEESIANETGKYYADCKETTPSPQARDDLMAKKLWDLSETLVSLKNNAK